MTKRLGLHIHTPGRIGLVERWIDQVRPSAMKFLDGGVDHAIVERAKAAGAITIFRLYVDKQPLGPDGGRFIERVAEAMRRYPAMMVAEGYNEQWQSGTELARRADFDIELMQAMDAIGRKAAIGSFSTGQPQIEDWRHYLPALRYAAEHGHYVALHEYGGGLAGMKWGVGRNQWNNGSPVIDDPCDDPATYYLGWWCLRYRRAVAEWRRLGLATVPHILITEGGIDDVQPRTGGQGKGYKDFRGQHPSAVGDYAAQWAWYLREASRDDYFAGAVDFGFATADRAWSSFDTSDDPAAFGRLIQEMIDMPDVTPAPTTTPADPLAAALAARLGDRLSDVRGMLPRHASRAFGRLDLARLVGIAVHHSASSRDTTPEAIARFHVNDNGWAGVGYHFVIRHGHVYYVGDLTTARAHVADRNHELVGICITGDYTATDPAPEDTTALRDLIAALDAHLGRALHVDGHLGFATAGHGTACPGRLLVPARSIREGTPAPVPAPTVDVAALVAAARAEHERAGVRLNPGSAIQRTMLADGVWPTTNEATAAGVTYARGESHAAGAWVYWWENGRVRRARIPAAAG